MQGKDRQARKQGRWESSAEQSRARPWLPGTTRRDIARRCCVLSRANLHELMTFWHPARTDVGRNAKSLSASQGETLGLHNPNSPESIGRFLLGYFNISFS